MGRSLEDAVEMLKKETFADAIIPRKLSMVQFFVPRSAHCKTIQPEYIKATNELLKENVYLFKVDSSKEKELSGDYNVTEFPTLITFRKGVRVGEYSGGR